METLLLDPQTEPRVEAPVSSALRSDADEVQVYLCPGLVRTVKTAKFLRLSLAILGAFFIVTHALLGLGEWSLFQFVIFASLLIAAVQNSNRPCQIHFGREWAEFVSLSERRTVHVSDVWGIVRHVPESDPGRLGHLVVQLSTGSVRLCAGTQETFMALTRFNPKASISTEQYNDTETHTSWM